MIENCAIATMDGSRHDQGGAEYRSGHVVAAGGRITAVGDGPAAASPDGARRIDGTGCLATPGLVNTHHHLYQWLTQARAQQSVLFDWLTELYPVWARINAGQVHAAATAGLAWLALSGCTTSSDHHYIFPRGGSAGGDALEAEVAAAARVGLRFHPCRGSMDLGRSAGGLPPDEIVEDTDAALAATEDAVRRFHDPAPGAMVRVAAAPCSPFSVSPRLMRETADLARRLGVHTHLAETREEDAYCRQTLGRTPAERPPARPGRRRPGWRRRRVASELAARHRADDQVRFFPGRDLLGQRDIRPLVRQVLLAGEEPDERPPLPGALVTDGAAQHRVPGLQRVEHRALGDPAGDPQFDLAVDAGQGPQVRRQRHPDHVSVPGHDSVCTSTDSTAGRSRTIGAQLSPASAEAYTWPPVVPK